MRMIDADELKTQLYESIMVNEDMDCLDFLRVESLIDAQPTAYDVDKVVQQLELLKKYDLNLADMMLDIQSNGLDRHFICLEDAIEIVKAGGTDGD